MDIAQGKVNYVKHGTVVNEEGLKHKNSVRSKGSNKDKTINRISALGSFYGTVKKGVKHNNQDLEISSVNSYSKIQSLRIKQIHPKKRKSEYNVIASNNEEINQVI